MAGLHEVADGVHFAPGDSHGGLLGAVDFSDDVAGTAVDDFAHVGFGGFEVVDGDVSPGVLADDHEGDFGLFAAVGVASVAQFVLDAGIGDDDVDIGRSEWDGLGLFGAAVDEDGVVLFGEDGSELVHDAAGNAGEFLFGLLAEQGFIFRVDGDAEDAFDEGGGGDLDGGGA